MHNFEVDFGQYNQFVSEVTHNLPHYQFDSQSYWINKSNQISKFIKINKKNSIKILENNYTELDYQIAELENFILYLKAEQKSLNFKNK